MIDMTKNNEKLAEFLGILLGDGNLNKSSNCITIVGSLEESDYYNNHVIPIIGSLFEVKPKLRYRKDRNAIYIDFNSKQVMDYLSKELELVRGNKRYAHVPKIIMNSSESISHFLRGLFDTDGFAWSFQNKQVKKIIIQEFNFVLAMRLLLMKLKNY